MAVRSRVGEVIVELAVDGQIMPGVVSLPHGWGHRRPGVQLRVASETDGASLNDITDDAQMDELTGTVAFSGVPVWVTASATSGATEH